MFPTWKITDALRAVLGCTGFSLELLVVAIALGHPVPGHTQEDPGRFEVRSATTELKDGVYLLSGWVEFRLSSDTRKALESGVPLTIRFEVELIRNRRFWFDRVDASLRQTYQLEYHALSERYLVRNVNSGEQTSFATLFSALNHLGRIDELPLIDASLLEPGADYDVRMRALLDTEDIPGPLKLFAFWRKDWSLASDWYQWHLERG